VGDFVTPAKAGQVTVVAVADKAKSKFFPNVQTLEEMGIKISNSSTRTLVAPAGVPKDILDVLSAAMKKAMDEPDHVKKMEDSGLTLRYMDPTQAATLWTEMDTLAKSLVAEARKQ
jgi:tripartite-type tricarboxylate transporter receptor subunit TctC